MSYFSTLSHYETIEKKALVEHKVWVLMLYITFFNETFIIIKRIHRDIMNQSFIYSPTDAPVSCLKKNNIKIYIKIYNKTAPTCFGVTVTPSSVSGLICAY